MNIWKQVNGRLFLHAAALCLVMVLVSVNQTLAQRDGTDKIGINIYEQKDSLMMVLPSLGDTLVADKPFLETPDIQVQGTYVLNQLFYKPFEDGRISVELKDYDINKNYYTEQRSEVFNLDKPDKGIINHTDTVGGYTMHVYQAGIESRITIFMNSYLYLEFSEDMESQNLTSLKRIVDMYPFERLKHRFLRFVESHKRLAKAQKNR